MRSLAITAVLLLNFPATTSARPVDARSYAQLMQEAELVLVVHATGWRPASDDDAIVPINSDNESLMPIFTKFKVLAVFKGEYEGQTFEICHYKYKSFSKRGGNGPLLVWFDKADHHGVRGPDWIGNADNDFVLFLKRDDAGRWTFITGQYDPELSVRQITAPLRPGTIFGYK